MNKLIIILSLTLISNIGISQHFGIKISVDSLPKKIIEQIDSIGFYEYIDYCMNDTLFLKRGYTVYIKNNDFKSKMEFYNNGELDYISQTIIQESIPVHIYRTLLKNIPSSYDKTYKENYFDATFYIKSDIKYYIISFKEVNGNTTTSKTICIDLDGNLIDEPITYPKK